MEESAGPNYTEVLYSPFGKTGLMISQTVSSAYIPLPGAASNLSALGESALSVAKNPYVLLGAADAALLYGVVNEGIAAYRGQCTF